MEPSGAVREFSFALFSSGKPGMGRYESGDELRNPMGVWSDCDGGEVRLVVWHHGDEV